MTVEAYVGTELTAVFGSINEQVFDLAQFFSQSSLFDIIDSFSLSSTPNRFKGDPIDNASWSSASDVFASNSWFVIRSLSSPITPQWECKIQGTEGAGFADPSGIDYGSVGTIRVIRYRFAPYGGWTLADVTPDFVGPSAESSGQNRNTYNSNGGGGGNAKNIIVADDGQLAMFTMRTDDVNRVNHFKGYIGDIIPIDATEQTMPRVHIYSESSLVAPDDISNNSGLPEENFLNTLPSIEYEDENGLWIINDPTWRLPTDSYDINIFTQPNFFSDPSEIDIAPYKPIINNVGFIGEIPLLGKTYGKGNGAKFNNGNWISYGEEYCMVSKWDPAISMR